MRIVLIAALLASTACTPVEMRGETPVAPSVAAACNADSLGDLVGKRASDARADVMQTRSGARTLRWIAPNTAVAGFVTPGDLVDVIFTDTIDDQSGGAVLKQRNWSEVVATAVRVLSIESMTDPKTDLPTVGGTVTIEATPRQVETITLAAGMGKPMSPAFSTMLMTSLATKPIITASRM